MALAKEAAAAAVHARRAVHHAPGLGQHVTVDVPVLAAGFAAQPGLGRDDVGGLVDVHLAHVDARGALTVAGDGQQVGHGRTGGQQGVAAFVRGQSGMGALAGEEDFEIGGGQELVRTADQIAAAAGLHAQVQAEQGPDAVHGPGGHHAGRAFALFLGRLEDQADAAAQVA